MAWPARGIKKKSHGFPQKNFSQFHQAVWPAIANI